jgi:hypothetical protein
MEGKYFLTVCMTNLTEENIFIFKIVSDHLNNKILPKDYIKKLVKNSNIFNINLFYLL